MYDLIIIGGGPAGYKAAELAGGHGLKTLLFDNKGIGGTCLNEGCVPTKVMLHSARLVQGLKELNKHGIDVKDYEINFEVILKKKSDTISKLARSIKWQLKKNGVELINDFGIIKGRNSQGFVVGSSTGEYSGKKLIVATGSVPQIPAIKGLEEGIRNGCVLTGREALELKKIPASLVIIGGGVVGLEFATYFNSFGSKVTIIEKESGIANFADHEVSSLLTKIYKDRGVAFELSSNIIEIAENGVIVEADSQIKKIEAGQVLITAGRKPAVKGCGLESLGVHFNEKGVLVNDKCETNIRNVYAIGDVNGHSMLAHTAYREANVCINNMVGNADHIQYNSVPSVIYTNPEVAYAGETEKSAADKGIKFRKSTISLLHSARYMIESENGEGFIKVLADTADDRIIGVQIIGNGASEIICGAGIIIEKGMTVKDARGIVAPHPTVSEVITEAIARF